MASTKTLIYKHLNLYEDMLVPSRSSSQPVGNNTQYDLKSGRKDRMTVA